jgi:hypothetical protein
MKLPARHAFIFLIYGWVKVKVGSGCNGEEKNSHPLPGTEP